jgi:rfaE bifunctional protein nucleotidyltransferase chain/domain
MSVYNSYMTHSKKTSLYKDSFGTEHKYIFNLKSTKKTDDLSWTKKIIDRKKVKLLATKLKAKKEKIVFTPGAFDMIHVGHSRFLGLAKSLGTILVVGINTDRSIKAYKGNDRPILNQDRRAEMLAHLAVVDYVVIFDEDWPDGVIDDLKPNKFLCIEENKWVGRLNERPDVVTVLKNGGEIYCSPRQDPELSTSKIILKLMEDGKRDLVKELSGMLNQENSLKGSL